MSLQQKMLAEMKAEMDARTEAIIAAADLCHEAEAIAEALREAGLEMVEAHGSSFLGIMPNRSVSIWVASHASTLKACDVIAAIFAADLAVREVYYPRLPGEHQGVTIRFADLEVGLRVTLPTDEAEALCRAFDKREDDPGLIGRSNLAAEVPA
jgi:hypothetical protein